MHSAQQFSFTGRRTAKSHSFFTREVSNEGLLTPTNSSRAESPTESDLESETDDNTLDKSWLNEMRTNIREIKDMKGML